MPNMRHARDSGGNGSFKNTRSVGIDQLDVVPFDLLNQFIDSVRADETVFPFPKTGLIEHPPVERSNLIPDAALLRRGCHWPFAAEYNARLIPR